MKFAGVALAILALPLALGCGEHPPGSRAIGRVESLARTVDSLALTADRISRNGVRMCKLGEQAASALPDLDTAEAQLLMIRRACDGLMKAVAVAADAVDVADRTFMNIDAGKGGDPAKAAAELQAAADDLQKSWSNLQQTVEGL